MATDDFERTDETPLAGDWSKTAGDTLKLKDGQVMMSSGSGQTTYQYTGSWSNDQWSQIEVADTVGTVGAAVRCGGGNYYAFRVWSGTSGEIMRHYAGLSGWRSVSYSVGDIIRLEVQGTTLSAYVNGVFKFSTTDSLLTSGNPGLHVNSAAEATAIESWEAGEYTPDPLSISVADCHAATCVF